ncbi:MAG: hypothetical protein JWN70_3681 [Planctomycetaceae bacterium]|nr:hypothetical protein [Planctomycetaceae bacterium]
MGTSLSQTIRETLSPETIGATLSSEVRAERAIAVEHLKEHLPERAYRDGLVELLTRESSLSPVLLDALSMIPGVGELPVFERLLTLLDAPTPAVKKNAARILARCFSQRCSELQPWFGAFEVRHECCFSGDNSTANQLWQWYREQQQSPDIAFGMLLTPEILCHLAAQHPTGATALARQFGYVESLEFAAAQPLLECGFWCVPDGLLPTEIERIGQRSAEIEAALLELLLGGGSLPILGFDLGSLLDVTALCGAVRSIDHQSLVEHKFENRLISRALGNIRRALCKHAPLSYCRKLLISDVLRDAEHLGVAKANCGNYVLEHAAAAVTHDADLRAERLLYLKSRWTQLPGRPAMVTSQWTLPVMQVADAPELKYRILTAQQWSQTRAHLDAPSPGALAAARLLQVVGREDLIGPLFQFEQLGEQSQLPCGIELQLMFSAQREHESLPWKQTLRTLGIPSPRRPEYRSMVEVSFPPSRSYLPQVLAPLLLERLGLFVEPADVALHLSFSGDLGADVRYLLFAQQFINRPRVRPGATRLARLMSKGFAHLNQDAVPLDGVDHGGQRTELRSYRFGYRGPSETEPLQQHFIDDIIETSLLIAAKVNPSPAIQQIWDDYCQRVTETVTKYPPIFSQLLESDWYACTAEPRDEEFALRLPISQAWIATRKWIAEQSADMMPRETFRDLRTSHAKSAWQLLNGDNSPEIPHAILARCGAIYFDARDL